MAIPKRSALPTRATKNVATIWLIILKLIHFQTELKFWLPARKEVLVRTGALEASTAAPDDDDDADGNDDGDDDNDSNDSNNSNDGDGDGGGHSNKDSDNDDIVIGHRVGLFYFLYLIS